jgi:tetratricopeptide (TPR) repeat protein
MLSPATARVAPKSVDRNMSRALVVDGVAASRDALAEQLSSLGAKDVVSCGNPIEAIRLMESGPFQLVLCEAEFESPMNGCQVLEYVRTRRLLAPSAAFLLVCAAAQRSLVVEARDWQPDGVLVKPVSAEGLGARVDAALRRRDAYAPLFAAAERRDPHAMLELVERRAEEEGSTAIEPLQWQARALLDLERFAEARDVCGRALFLRGDLGWALIGLARCDRANGRFDEAVTRLCAVIRAQPALTEAYDQLIAVLQELDQPARALAVAKQAHSSMSTTRRLRQLGEVAYAQGDIELAQRCYAELVQRTGGSLTHDAADDCMLGQVFVDRGAIDEALRAVDRATKSADVPARALAEAVQAQVYGARGQREHSMAAARRAIDLSDDEGAPENVMLLVARGAFAAGLLEEAQRVAARAILRRRRARQQSPLIRKVLADAGIDAGRFVAEVVERAERRAAPPDGTAAGAAAPPRMDASSHVARALECLHAARFEDALRHVEEARAELPRNPMVLMAAIQVQLLRMRARGYDDSAAEDVRSCLAELDRQIPGQSRVIPSLAGRGVGAPVAPAFVPRDGVPRRDAA